MNRGFVVVVITVAQEVIRYIAAMIMRILSGNPSNEFERRMADELRAFLQRLISRSRLMNPAMP